MTGAEADYPVTLPPIHTRLSPNQSSRDGEPVRLVVVHRPVGSYASAIDTMLKASHEASAHAILREDGHDATQLVPWHRKAWACVSFNSISDNIETPDHIWTGLLTPNALRVMHVCARVVAKRLFARGLPAHHVTAGQLAHARGWTTHLELGADGGGHSDPTADTHRLAVFGALVAHELERGHFRPSWGID